MAVKRTLASLFILFVFSLPGMTAQLEMKSATVAGFINKGKSNQDNINILMTKSLSTFLSKISKNITPYKDVEEIAQGTNFWSLKVLDSDKAINIAQHFSMEQVITGDYAVNDKTGTIVINVFVYNVVNGQLLFQRNYKGNAGPEIFDTIDKMILDVSGLLVGKPIELGYVNITVRTGKTNYKLFVNDAFVKVIGSNNGYFDNFISGQSIDIVLKSGKADSEVLRRRLDIQSGKTNEVEYNPAGVLILETLESGVEVSINGTFIGKTDESGELKVPDVESGKKNIISVKYGNGTASTTNVVINEAELKVVVFKNMGQNKPSGTVDNNENKTSSQIVLSNICPDGNFESKEIITTEGYPSYISSLAGKWQLIRNEPTTADGQAAIENGECHVKINAKGIYNWNIQLCMMPFKLENGNNYEVTFDARSSSPKNINVNFQKIGGDWPIYSRASFDIETEMKTYSFKFYKRRPTDSYTRLQFNLSGSTGDVWISNVRVTEEEGD